MLTIKGTTYPITDIYTNPIDNEDVVNNVMSTLEKVLEDKERGVNLPLNGHILIFLDTIPNIEAVNKRIEIMLD